MQEGKGQIPDFIQKVIKMMKVPIMIFRNIQNLLTGATKARSQSFTTRPNLNNESSISILDTENSNPLCGKYWYVQTQLNMYGFHKVCRNKNSINFRNKFFFQGNEANFHLIKRRKKDGEDEEESGSKMQDTFIKFINDKHGEEFPELPTIVQQILQFKQRNAKTMQKLRKSLDVLGRELNERKSKSIKPTIVEIKEMITSIQDSSKKTQMSMEQLLQDIDKDNASSVKKEELEQHEHIKPKQKQQEPLPATNSQISASMSYPALHSAGNYFGPVFHPGAALLGVSSLCSFNSVTNFMS